MVMILLVIVIVILRIFSSNSTSLAGNTTYDSYQTPTVVHDSMQSAEHIATAIDYDKDFWWTPYKRL